MSTSVVQISSPSHILDIELPTSIRVGTTEFIVPDYLKNKSIQYVVNKDELLKTCFISPTLGYLLKAQSSQNPSQDLILAKKFLLYSIQDLVETEYISGKVHHGYMGLAQVNSFLDKDTVAITQRTWSALTEEDKKWKNCSEVIVVRYPNLGPNTTSIMKLMIIEDSKDGLSFGCIDGVLDGVYINPIKLKESFEGDADGDTLFLIPFRHNGVFTSPLKSNRIHDPNLVNSTKEEIKKKFSRGSKENRKLEDHISICLDPDLIGPATYIVRSRLLRYAQQNKCSLKEAWMKISPEGLELVESVMDLRKGNMTAQQVDKLVQTIQNEYNLVTTLRNNGDPYHSVITSSVFPETFPLVYSSIADFAREVFG